MQHCVGLLDELGVPNEHRIVSAHRTPDLMARFASEAAERGVQVIVAGAGGAAHLPGMIAAQTWLPVLGVPVESRALKGLDSLLSIAQMPAGVAVGTLAIGVAGAKNAALLAASIVGLHDAKVRRAVREISSAPDEIGPRAKAAMRADQPLLPGAKIGVMGGGQLGRMFAIAARRMGYRVHTFSPEKDGPAAQLSDYATAASYDDEEAVTNFARAIDVLTFEFENIPAATIEWASRGRIVRPRGEILLIAQNRLREKEFLSGAGFPVAPFRRVANATDLTSAVEAIGRPAIFERRGLRLRRQRSATDRSGDRARDDLGRTRRRIMHPGKCDRFRERNFCHRRARSRWLDRRFSGLRKHSSQSHPRPHPGAGANRRASCERSARAGLRGRDQP